MKSYDYMPTANDYFAPASTDNNITLIIPEKAWGIEVSQWAKVGIFDNNGTLLGSGVYDNNTWLSTSVAKTKNYYVLQTILDNVKAL